MVFYLQNSPCRIWLHVFICFSVVHFLTWTFSLSLRSLYSVTLVHGYKLINHLKMSHVRRNPFFGVCDHSRTTCDNICWSVAWINRTSPSKGVGLGSPLGACSVYADLTLSVHTVNNFSSVSNYQTHVCLCIWGPYARLAFVSNMLSSWKKLLLLLLYVRLKPACAATEKLVRGFKFRI